MPHQRKLLRQDSDNGNNKSRAFSEVGDKGYDTSYTEAFQQQRKRHKISTLSCKVGRLFEPSFGSPSTCHSRYDPSLLILFPGT